MTLNVEVITPEKVVWKDEADFVAAPAFDGEIGILPGHTRLLTKLGLGELRLKKGDDIQMIAVTGGFLEVHDGSQVSVFAETADMAGEIDLERERQNAERARTVLKSKGQYSDIELEQAEAAIKAALLKLKVGQAKTRKKPPRQA